MEGWVAGPIHGSRCSAWLTAIAKPVAPATSQAYRQLITTSAVYLLEDLQSKGMQDTAVGRSISELGTKEHWVWISKPVTTSAG